MQTLYLSGSPHTFTLMYLGGHCLMCCPNFQGDDDGDYDDDLTKVDPLNEVCYLNSNIGLVKN